LPWINGEELGDEVLEFLGVILMKLLEKDGMFLLVLAQLQKYESAMFVIMHVCAWSSSVALNRKTLIYFEISTLWAGKYLSPRSDADSPITKSPFNGHRW
jgi:hypothetical protein